MRILLALSVLAACSSPSGGSADAAQGTDSGGSGSGSGSQTIDAGMGVDGSMVGDGTPTRIQCTNNFGNALSTQFGRLDGFLVAIVQPGAHGCNGDTDHVHLQIKANGQIYDVAVNVGSPGVDDVHTTTRDMVLPAWSEGWHTGVIDDYVTDGVHSSDMPNETRTVIASQITSDLSTVNHITVFATGYGPTGAHLVHRDGNGHDGLVVTEPLSTPSHARFFSFTSQTF